MLLAGLAGLIGYWLFAGRPAWVGAVLAFAIVAMAIRLLLTARDNRRIAGELESALADRERIAVTDPLTGLLNRRAVEQAVRAHEGPLGVVVLELETVALGFEQRDDVVAAAVGRLRALVGAGPIVGRTGAAELVLLVPNPGATRATAERLRAAVAGEPFAAGAVGACAGVAWAPDHGATGEELLRAAQQARELARELGGNQVRAHGDTIDAALLEGLADEADRRRGCEGHGRAVGRWAAAVAAQLSLDDETRRRCELAARLHDVGLISAPDAVLRRPHLTTRDDLVRLEDHPLAGDGAQPRGRARARRRRPRGPAPSRHAGGRPAARGPDRRRLQRVGEPARGSRRPRPAERRGRPRAIAHALRHRLRPRRRARVPEPRALRRWSAVTRRRTSARSARTPRPTRSSPPPPPRPPPFRG